MTARRPFAFGLLLVSACRAYHPVHEGRPRGVFPLDEAGFDAFAGQAARMIVAAAHRDGYSLPFAIGAPVLAVAPGLGDVDTDALDAFARALPAGIADRCAGAVEFTQDPPEMVRFHSKVVFGQSADPPRSPTVTFTVTDAATRSEVLRASTAIDRQLMAGSPRLVLRSDPPVEPTGGGAAAPDRRDLRSADAAPNASGPAAARRSKSVAAGNRRSQPRAGTPEPTDERVSIGDDETTLLARVDRSRHCRTLDGLDGRVVCMSDELWARTSLIRRAARTDPDGRRRVELELVSSRGDLEIRLRVAFLDATGAQVEMTPVLRYGLVEGYPIIMTVVARHANADGFVVLLDDDRDGAGPRAAD